MSSKKGSATLIGAFVIGGIVLVIAGVIAAGGGGFFTRKERAVMHFSGSIYGLQVGAPVVFRGVRLGSVTSIGLDYDAKADNFWIPVVAEIEPEIIRGLDQNGAAAASGARPAAPRGSQTISSLVARGLRAQLSLQSLLTGQLYVDLDLRPQRPANLRGGMRGATEIPTTATAIQALKGQLEGMDLRQLLDDVSAIAASARSVVAGPQLKLALDNVVDITASVKRITGRLDQRIAPMAESAEAALAETRRALGLVGGAAERVGNTADRIRGTSDRVGALVAEDSPLMRDLHRAAAELARTAAALRQHAGEDGALVQDAGRALHDMSRAARAVRELAEMLERNPQSLLRGRRGEGRNISDDDSAAPSVALGASRPS
ncbi:MCE family protein [Aquincola sp. S2]|uniref:MCE family protein n=1 Tax=Pseudaquabacterium terrae TaxID=2732868 RepID=A0ABX2EHR5_9BURK|nr:MlaD family protein [Aquabacterium terrae]NRF68140.1 MCE family protein [Aquabacterium terrae]